MRRATNLRRELSARSGSLPAILAAAAGSVAAMLVVRTFLWWPPGGRPGEVARLVRGLATFAADDLVTFAPLTFGALLLALALGRRRRWLELAWLVVGAGFALAAGIDVTAVRWLGAPVTFQWLYYADLLRSFTSQAAVAGVLDWPAVAWPLGTLAVFFAVRWLSRRPFERWSPLSLAMVVLLAAATVRAAFLPAPPLMTSGRIANPVHELVASTVASLRNPLDGIAPDPDDRDYRIAPSPARAAADPRRRPRNVIVLVMESVGAQPIWGAGAPPLPALRDLATRGLSLPNTYVAAPSSTRSAFVLTTGRYPLFSYRPESYALVDRPLVTVADRFRQAGYATGFFMGGEFAFQGLDTFLHGRGFDVMRDMATIPCTRHYAVSSERWQNVDHVADRCVVDDLLRWIPAQHQPYLAILWSINTHFPYSPEGSAPADPRLRHRLALEELDAQIARVVQAVRAAGRLDDTLFVVVGDHGEAFRQHGNFSHGTTVFEEEARVPMILSNPQLFAGQTDLRLASLADVAPTLLAANGLPPEPDWQGRSAIDPQDRRRVYMFAVQHDFQLGYREGMAKVIWNLRDGAVRAYDLRRDPGEHAPIELHGAAADRARRRMASWVAYQQHLYR